MESLPLVAASGFALGLVLTFHTRSSLIQFGAEALIPSVQSLAFFVEIGPLVAGLLVAGRAGAGIGAELANLRVTEQIESIESFSIDSLKLNRGLCGGEPYLASFAGTFLPPTLKTAVFGFIIGLISSCCGYKPGEGSAGVGHALRSKIPPLWAHEVYRGTGLVAFERIWSVCRSVPGQPCSASCNQSRNREACGSAYFSRGRRILQHSRIVRGCGQLPVPVLRSGTASGPILPVSVHPPS